MTERAKNRDVVLLCDGGRVPLVGEGLWHVVSIYPRHEYPVYAMRLDAAGSIQTTFDRVVPVLDYVVADESALRDQIESAARLDERRKVITEIEAWLMQELNSYNRMGAAKLFERLRAGLKP